MRKLSLEVSPDISRSFSASTKNLLDVRLELLEVTKTSLLVASVVQSTFSHIDRMLELIRPRHKARKASICRMQSAHLRSPQLLQLVRGILVLSDRPQALLQGKQNLTETSRII